MVNDTHWLNKIHIGEGTLKQFKIDYDKISNQTDRFITASQLYTRQESITVGNVSTSKTKNTYEYIIYYKQNPVMEKVEQVQSQEINID